MATTYTIDRWTSITYESDLYAFLKEEVPEISKMFNDKFDYVNCDLEKLISRHDCLFLVCRRNGEIRGILMAFYSSSVFDPNVSILQQQLFYVKPDSGRTAYHLFKKFIDIGKSQANHIITMLTSNTNIKPETLERLGFKELETLYRMEV